MNVCNIWFVACVYLSAEMYVYLVCVHVYSDVCAFCGYVCADTVYSVFVFIRDL